MDAETTGLAFKLEDGKTFTTASLLTPDFPTVLSNYTFRNNANEEISFDLGLSLFRYFSTSLIFLSMAGDI